MNKKVISFGIGATEINRAIRELEKYKREFLQKVDVYRKRIADAISTEAQSGFNSSEMDDIVNGGMRSPNVNVSVTERGDISVVVADGEDAIWCEFGAGVYHNGAVGSSPNPYGVNVGYTIGGYGKGRGKQAVWGYYEDEGDKSSLVLTHGTPASMPMYKAVQSVRDKAVSIAKEVFG